MLIWFSEDLLSIIFLQNINFYCALKVFKHHFRTSKFTFICKLCYLGYFLNFHIDDLLKQVFAIYIKVLFIILQEIFQY